MTTAASLFGLTATVLLGLATPSVAAGAQTAIITLNGIAIAHDPARWDIADGGSGSLLDGTRDAGLYFYCKEPVCHGRPFVWAATRTARAGATSGPACPVSLARDPVGGQVVYSGPVAQTRPGLVLYQWATASGCRARTPLHLGACGESGEFVYEFGSGGSIGCSGIEGVPQALFDELLAGILLVPKNAP
jgi:hypothetical protein